MRWLRGKEDKAPLWAKVLVRLQAGELSWERSFYVTANSWDAISVGADCDQIVAVVWGAFSTMLQECGEADQGPMEEKTFDWVEQSGFFYHKDIRPILVMETKGALLEAEREIGGHSKISDDSAEAVVRYPNGTMARIFIEAVPANDYVASPDQGIDFSGLDLTEWEEEEKR